MVHVFRPTNERKQYIAILDYFWTEIGVTSRSRFFSFLSQSFFKQLVSYPKTWSKVVSIQMNQTNEHEHKLVLLGSKLDEKSGKACAGKKQRTRGAQQLLLFGQRYTCLLAFFSRASFFARFYWLRAWKKLYEPLFVVPERTSGMTRSTITWTSWQS